MIVKDILMTKEDALAAIKKAKEAHEAQMQKIETALNGKEVTNPTAVEKTKCEFGKWLYDPDGHVQEIIGSQFYENLDVEHEKWHREYLRIFNILFKGQKKQGLFSKILGKPAVDPLELDKARLYYTELQETTAGLLKALGSAERRISALQETKFH